MAQSTPINQASSAPAVSVPYHTAYRGSVTGPDGKFDHFVRKVDRSHFEDGYWRFQSRDDELRAHAHGFASPEDILLAHEHGGDTDNSIMIRWVRGNNDPSFHMALSGTASQHLQCIYEVRRELGLPMSSRGQIPIYPKSSDPKLERYWENMRNLNQEAQIDPALHSPGRPTPSPITPRSEQPSTPPVGASPQQAQTYSKAIATSTHAARAAQPNPTVQATASYGSPNAPSARPAQLTGASPLSWQVSPTVQLPQASPPDAPWLSSRPSGATPDRNPSVTRIPRAGPFPSLVTSISQPPFNSGQGITQHNWVHHQASDPTPYYTLDPVTIQPRASPRSSTDSGLADRRPVTPGTGSSDSNPTSSTNISEHERFQGTMRGGGAEPLGSPAERASSTAVASGPRNASPRNAGQSARPTASPAQRGDISRPSTSVGRPSIASGSATHTPEHWPSPSGFSSPVAAPASSSGTHSGARPITTPPRPHTPRTATPTSSTSRPRSRTSQNALSSPVAPPLSSPLRQTQGAPVALPTASKTSRGNSIKPTATARANHQSPRIIERTEHSAGTSIVEDADTTMASPALTQEERDVQAFRQAVDMFGCMDCGEDIGHKADCHIGSTYIPSSLPSLVTIILDMKPIANPTVIDLRTLCDAVAHFDPTPAKTTHFNQFPTPPLEDAQTQIEGMAEMIRNEQSYKDNPELAGLPDGVMVFMWAMRDQIVSEDE
jgi:hypothetical protein